MSGLAILCIAGCQLPGKKDDKPLTQLKIFVESPENDLRTKTLPFFQRDPVEIVVDQSPILDETEIEDVALINGDYGHNIRLQFSRRGSWLLETETASNQGRRLVILAVFDETERVIAAIHIRRRIGSGQLEFTPDATVEESQRIVDGLKNVIASIKENSMQF